MYFIAIQMNYLVCSGIFALFPTAVYNTFGTLHGPQLYALLCLGSSFASVFDTFLIKVVYGKFGYPIEDLFYIGAISSFLAMVISYFFREEIDIVRMERKGHIEWNK